MGGMTVTALANASVVAKIQQSWDLARRLCPHKTQVESGGLLCRREDVLAIRNLEVFQGRLQFISAVQSTRGNRDVSRIESPAGHRTFFGINFLYDPDSK